MNDDEPVKRSALLILLQAQRDHATELVVGASTGAGAPIRYKIGDAWHDWQSPGLDQVSGLISEFGRLAGFNKRPFPREGLIDTKYSGARLCWVARMQSDQECVLTPLEL